MKRNENKEFQSQVIFSPKLSLSLSNLDFGFKSAGSKMSHVQCLDLDRWYLFTSIDINLHLSRNLMVSIDSTGCASIDCSSSRRPLHGQLG
ncbi:hypothetical protein IGI04_035952 [Brassica rapa subsp. trilocularis]|uniref:Uncharacterized protein n=1 Tax=Brassica rapa subsp. trilocularis TaxID=1813537 RepID=A0ABQ7LD21_BRACM|nr:hypothetical protein IGI04_035952 [Brassica rapa subsp. trilocularis]